MMLGLEVALQELTLHPMEPEHLHRNVLVPGHLDASALTYSEWIPCHRVDHDTLVEAGDFVDYFAIATFSLNTMNSSAVVFMDQEW